MGLLKHVFVFFRVQNLEKIVFFQTSLSNEHDKFGKKMSHLLKSILSKYQRLKFKILILH